MWIIYALMLINPFLSSGGTIAMRKMKKFSEYVVSWYMNWCILLTSLAILLGTMGNQAFDTFGHFNWQSWAVLVTAGVFNVVQGVFRFKALKYQKASLLQKFNPLITIWQFIFDLTIFKLSFTWVQYIGYGILFAAYGLQLLKYILYDRAANKEKQAKRDEKEKLKTEMIKNLIHTARKSQTSAADFYNRTEDGGGSELDLDEKV